MIATPSKLLTPEEVAEQLRVAVETLATWRCTGKNLPYVKVGSRVRYKSKDVDAYIEKRTVGKRSA